MSEQLRMTAEVVDKFSGPLRTLRDRLREVRAPQSVAQMGKAFDGMGTAALNAGRVIRNTLNTALIGLGAGGLGAAAGIAAVSRALNSMGGNVQELRELAKETGLTVQQLRVMEAAAPRFAIGADTMRSGIQRFAQTLHQFRRRRGSVYTDLLGGGAGDLTEALVQSARKGDTGKALATVMDYLAQERKRNPQNAATIAQMLFGNDLFGRLGNSDWRKILGETDKALGPISEDAQKKALAFKSAIDQLTTSLTGLRDSVVGELAGEMSKLVKELQSFVDANRGELGKDIANGIRDIGAAARVTASALLTLIRALRTIKKWNDQSAENPNLPSWLGGPTQNPVSKAAEKLAKARERRGYIQRWIEQNPDAPKALMEGRKKGLAAADEDIRQLEDVLEKAIEKATERATEKGTKKGVEGALENWRRKTSADADANGGAQLHYASYGGTSSPGAGGQAGARAGAVRGAMEQIGAARRKWKLGPEQSKEMAAAIRQSAGDLGISAKDLAAIVSYETAGTMDPWKRGPRTKWGTHRGLIQWGEPQAQKYGVHAGMSISEQMQAATKYLRDRGVKPGMGLLEIYKAINAGSATAPDSRADINGTQVQHAARIRAQHYGTLEGLDARAAGAPGAGMPGRPPSWLFGRSAPSLPPGSLFQTSQAANPYGDLRNSRGTLDITLNGFPSGWHARANTGSLFRETNVNRGKNMATAGGDE